MESATPMSDMLDDDNDFRAPLPAGFDVEQWKKEISSEELAFYNAIPVFKHPEVEAPTNETYWEFGRIRKRMGLGPYSYNDTQYNLIRATCEYLTAQDGKLPELATVAVFLGQGWQAVMAQLESYPPVLPLLAYAQHLATYRPDSPYPSGHIEIAVRDAEDYVQGCLDFLAQQQLKTEKAALERELEHHQAQQEHAQRMAERYERIVSVLVKILIFGLGITVGWWLAH